MKKTMMVVLALLVLGATGAQAGDILHCEILPSPANGHVSQEVRVYTDEKGELQFYAHRCRAYGGHYCLPEIGDYVNYGPVERETFNGHPTMIFKSDSVRIFPSCGRTHMFMDQREGKLEYGLTFLANECTVQ